MVTNTVESEGIHTHDPSLAPSGADARAAGGLALAAVGLCVIGAILQQTSGADLFRAMETGDAAERARELSSVAEHSTQLVAGLSVWFFAFPLFAIAGVMLSRLGQDRRAATVARTALTGCIGGVLVFLSLMVTLVVVVAPAHAAGADVDVLAHAVGFAASTTDWAISAIMLGIGPVLAVWAGRTSWAPAWLVRFSIVPALAAVVEIVALLADERSLANVLVPAGLVFMAAAGIAALRSTKSTS